MILEEMLAIMPHHKGTDKLRADLRRRIAFYLVDAERKAHNDAHLFPAAQDFADILDSVRKRLLAFDSGSDKNKKKRTASDREEE